jgi:hypothetical protein
MEMALTTTMRHRKAPNAGLLMLPRFITCHSLCFAIKHVNFDSEMSELYHMLLSLHMMMSSTIFIQRREAAADQCGGRPWAAKRSTALMTNIIISGVIYTDSRGKAGGNAGTMARDIMSF